jgi:hypothetical protein
MPVVTEATGIVTKGFNEKPGSHTKKKKKFNRFNKKDIYIWGITYNTKSTAA